MKLWQRLPLLLANAQSMVLVSVVETRGSTPREAGTYMLISATFTEDTIGGGHLEWEAIAQARAMLLQASPPPPCLHRYSLGASLGQCCGGVVWLLYEVIDSRSLEMWRDFSHHLEKGGALNRALKHTDTCSTWTMQSPTQPSICYQADDSGWQLNHTIQDNSQPISVYGAGHVGRALVKLLASLSQRVRWLDCREDAFRDCPDGVTSIVNDFLEEEVATAPANSFHIVMTHSHTLDLILCEKILQRSDTAWCGLIGSTTKAERFRHKLINQGFQKKDLQRLTCPIGIPGITSKTPEAIAISVAAQILQLSETLSAKQSVQV
ncbi:xanthine dehydrogenase accessory protein XdhC [Uliginosibacterium gangwonense]|uniref:xanthine dehydrogenase accessory protein XdhC n=1 Tax=Uliginosibacterium gangwonense TaxID=392736 RepID=UPI0003812052|nr:xanthine dehydrogenase accessory protein XdhC [Uliginosibacterium gangwonense]